MLWLATAMSAGAVVVAHATGAGPAGCRGGVAALSLVATAATFAVVVRLSFSRRAAWASRAWQTMGVGVALLVSGSSLLLCGVDEGQVGRLLAPSGLALCGYLVITAAAIDLVGERRTKSGSACLFEAALVGASVGLLMWITRLAPLTDSGRLSPSMAIVTAAVVGSDVLLVSLAAVLMRTQPQRRTAHRRLLVATAVLAATHVVGPPLGVWGGLVWGMPFAGALALWSGWLAAVLHPSAALPAEPWDDEPREASILRVGLVSIPVLTGVGVLAVAAIAGGARREILAAGVVLPLAGLVQLTRRVRQGERHELLAGRDGLTGLPNRTLFLDRLDVALAQARRRGGQLAVLFLDLDGFKDVNDSYGHAAGNELLCEVSDRLRAEARSEDTVARIGGDEFVLLLSQIRHPDQAMRVAHRVIRAFDAPFTVGPHPRSEVFVTPSIGIAVWPTDGHEAETLLENADTAMYRAKGAARGSCRRYGPDMNAESHRRLALLTNLRTAMDRGELVLHYQPTIALDSGRIVGVEALVRWNHPEHGMLPPGAFIPLAEESGLIMALGEWVLGEACAQMLRWHAAGHLGLRVAVNLSARQFDGPIESVVARALRVTGLDPSRLEVEMTETAAIRRPEEARGALAEITAMGVGCALDDFGTGYSDLSLLATYPVQTVKIDKSFVGDIGDGANGSRIVSGVIAMAHSLGLRVVAEGVETAEQLAFLAAHGCDEMQGFFYSEPVDAEALGALLREERQTRRRGPLRVVSS